MRLLTSDVAVIFPSGYSILVDCGESESGDLNARRISTKLRAILNSSYVDVAVLSHLHRDHIGSAGEGGRSLSLLVQTGFLKE
jgi:glyoxylase-like metal-dependent hydrolase (beta-lactamase superfamily II)